MSVQQKQNQPTTLTADMLGIELPEREATLTGCAIAVRALLQNWRQGTVACKGRSDVAFSNKKPWKQKGTGRARAGSKRSPLWKGGGVIHGPQARTKQLKVAKKVKQNALHQLFADRLQSNRIHVIDWAPSQDAPRTKEAYEFLKNNGLLNDTLVMFFPIDDHVSRSSFVNIPNVRIVSFDALNAYDALSGNRWVILQKDMDAFKEMVSRWS